MGEGGQGKALGVDGPHMSPHGSLLASEEWMAQFCQIGADPDCAIGIEGILHTYIPTITITKRPLKKKKYHRKLNGRSRHHRSVLVFAVQLIFSRYCG